jgi:hypothetical protein
VLINNIYVEFLFVTTSGVVELRWQQGTPMRRGAKTREAAESQDLRLAGSIFAPTLHLGPNSLVVAP